MTILKTIIPFFAPIAFEIANILSGNWINDDGSFNLNGKIITILIGVFYLFWTGYWTYHDKKNAEDVATLNVSIRVRPQCGQPNVNLGAY